MKIEKWQYRLTSNTRQRAHSCDSSAFQRKMVLFINLLGKGLTQEINRNGDFIGWDPGARFLKVPRTFRTRKAIRKITTCSFCKADIFTCCKGNKNKNNYKVSCLETPSFWRYKENYVTRNTPEKFRDFRETGPWKQEKFSISFFFFARS